MENHTHCDSERRRREKEYSSVFFLQAIPFPVMQVKVRVNHTYRMPCDDHGNQIITNVGSVTFTLRANQPPHPLSCTSSKKAHTQKIKLHRLGKLVPSNYANYNFFFIAKKSFGNIWSYKSLSCAWEGCLDGTDINSGKRPFTFVVFGATLILVTEISTKFIVLSNRAKYQFHLAIFMIYHSLSFLVTYRIWITEPGLVSELPTKNNFTI